MKSSFSIENFDACIFRPCQTQDNVEYIFLSCKDLYREEKGKIFLTFDIKPELDLALLILYCLEYIQIAECI